MVKHSNGTRERRLAMRVERRQLTRLAGSHVMDRLRRSLRPESFEVDVVFVEVVERRDPDGPSRVVRHCVSR